MDEITYTALEIAYNIGVTNKTDLIYRVKERFTPDRYTNIENVVTQLFNANYFQSYFIGNIIPANPLDEMSLTSNAKKLFLEEKAKRDYLREDLVSKIKKTAIPAKQDTAYNIIIGILIGLAVLIIGHYIFHIG